MKIQAKGQGHMETNKLRVIVLPENKTRKQQLRDKLVEYEGRMRPYAAPEQQMDTICKVAVLERLLRDGHVNTHELFLEMAKTYGLGFDAHAFNNARDVISDYCKTGGEKTHGGTGLHVSAHE